MTQNADLLEQYGYKIRLTHVGLEWIASVALPEQRQTLVLAPDREAALAKAYEWIEAQRQSARNSS